MIPQAIVVSRPALLLLSSRLKEGHTKLEGAHMRTIAVVNVSDLIA
jgi:hypothetical protein